MSRTTLFKYNKQQIVTYIPTAQSEQVVLEY